MVVSKARCLRRGKCSICSIRRRSLRLGLCGGSSAFWCVFVLAFLATATPMAKLSPPSWFWGCWLVTKSLPTAGVSGLSQKQVDAIIGTRIRFSPAYARSGCAVIRSPKYSVTVLSAREFFKLGYFPLSQIGVHGQQVTEVQIHLPVNMSDMKFPGSRVYLRRKDIIINVENQSFLAVRAKTGEACGCVKKIVARPCGGRLSGRLRRR